MQVVGTACLWNDPQGLNTSLSSDKLIPRTNGKILQGVNPQLK